MSYPTVSCTIVPVNFTTILSTSARVTFWTRKLLACPPARSMSKTSASEPGTRTSFSFSLGTETQRIAGAGFRGGKGDSIDLALGLHGV